MKELFASGCLSARHIFLIAVGICKGWRNNLVGASLAVNASTISNRIPHRSARLPDSSLAISVYLREPLTRTLEVVKANQTFLRKVEKTRNNYVPAATLKTYIDSIDVLYSNQFIDLCRQDSRSRIIASFHFGDFLYGLSKLVASQPTDRITKVLSQKECTATFLGNMERGFGKDVPGAESQLVLGRVQPRELSAILRGENTSLVMFADLPSSYGETVAIKFLGRRAWFPKGIAVLSLANKVPIVPVICYAKGSKNYVEIGKQIEPTRLKGESKEGAILRITQLSVEFFEYFFKQHQEQWRYLSALPSYFVEPPKENLIKQ